jgi:hypothetical protein
MHGSEKCACTARRTVPVTQPGDSPNAWEGPPRRKGSTAPCRNAVSRMQTTRHENGSQCTHAVKLINQDKHRGRNRTNKCTRQHGPGARGTRAVAITFLVPAHVPASHVGSAKWQHQPNTHQSPLKTHTQTKVFQYTRKRHNTGSAPLLSLPLATACTTPAAEVSQAVVGALLPRAYLYPRLRSRRLMTPTGLAKPAAAKSAAVRDLAADLAPGGGGKPVEPAAGNDT